MATTKVVVVNTLSFLSHYSDVTWASCHISQFPRNLAVCWTTCSGEQKWILVTLILWGESTGDMWISLTKDQKCERRFRAGVLCKTVNSSWWRHQMETFPALLALCAGNSPVTGEFPSQRPVTRSFDVSFDLRLNKRLGKQSWGWWFETPSWSLWRHRNVICYFLLQLHDK